MLIKLRTQHGVEVWINKKLEEEIENTFKELFKTDKLYYYYYSCPGTSYTSRCCGEHKLIWLGPIGLINYIRKVQSKEFDAPVLCVTSCKSKGELERFLEKDSDPIFPPADYVWKEYWIGDVDRRHNMQCGDEMFIALWNRIKNHVTKNARTKKKKIF